jgi:hypothetical protein
MGDIWEILKTFFTSQWLENHLFYLFLLGLGVSMVLVIILIIRTYKDDCKKKKEQRKRDKNTLRFISNKKNKTY